MWWTTLVTSQNSGEDRSYKVFLIAAIAVSAFIVVMRVFRIGQ